MKTLLALLAAPLLFLPATAPASPITKNGDIEVKPGDSYIIQFEKNGNKLTNPEVVAEFTDKPCIRIQCASSFASGSATPEKPDPLLNFMLTQSPDHTILLIQKKFDGTLEYKTMVHPDGGKKAEKRNNLPLQNELPMFEQYPQKLETILLSDFRIK